MTMARRHDRSRRRWGGETEVRLVLEVGQKFDLTEDVYTCTSLYMLSCLATIHVRVEPPDGNQHAHIQSLTPVIVLGMVECQADAELVCMCVNGCQTYPSFNSEPGASMVHNLSRLEPVKCCQKHTFLSSTSSCRDSGDERVSHCLSRRGLPRMRTSIA